MVIRDVNKKQEDVATLCRSQNIACRNVSGEALAKTDRALGGAAKETPYTQDNIHFMNEQPNNPLHGITLEMMVNSLVEYYGWDELGVCINIRCFQSNPSVKSSLKFLRRTPWAREKVEKLYLKTQEDLD